MRIRKIQGEVARKYKILSNLHLLSIVWVVATGRFARTGLGFCCTWVLLGILWIDILDHRVPG